MSLLATAEGKQNILTQKHLQLSLIPLQPISENSLYLNLKGPVMLVVNVRIFQTQNSSGWG